MALDVAVAAGHELRLSQREHLLTWNDDRWSSVAVSDIEVTATGRVMEGVVSLTMANTRGSMERLTVVDRMTLTFDPGFEQQWDALWRADDPLSYVAVLRGHALAQTASIRRGLRVQYGDQVVLSDDLDADWGDLAKELFLTTSSGSDGFFRCVYQCFGELTTPIGLTGLLCVSVGGAACTAAAVGSGGIGAVAWVECMSLILTGCGYTTLIGELAALAACIIKCSI